MKNCEIKIRKNSCCRSEKEIPEKQNKKKIDKKCGYPCNMKIDCAVLVSRLAMDSECAKESSRDCRLFTFSRADKRKCLKSEIYELDCSPDIFTLPFMIHTEQKWKGWKIVNRNYKSYDHDENVHKIDKKINLVNWMTVCSPLLFASSHSSLIE